MSGALRKGKAKELEHYVIQNSVCVPMTFSPMKRSIVVAIIVVGDTMEFSVNGAQHTATWNAERWCKFCGGSYVYYISHTSVAYGANCVYFPDTMYN